MNSFLCDFFLKKVLCCKKRVIPIRLLKVSLTPIRLRPIVNVKPGMTLTTRSLVVNDMRSLSNWNNQ
jgi:hypothetical protein